MRPLAKLIRPRGALHQPFWVMPEVIAPSNGFEERSDVDFLAMVQEVHKKSGVVAACITARALTFSEIRFQWQRLENGVATKLFGDASLELLENPWPGGTTGELLVRMEQDSTLAGAFFAVVRGTDADRRLVRLRPDWVKLVIDTPVTGQPWHTGAKLVGISYQPPAGVVENFPMSEVVFYSPEPDPEQRFAGKSLLRPVLDEIYADRAATRHKREFFRRGAALGTVITYDSTVDPDAFDAFVEKFKEQHEGPHNAYRTLHVMGAADVKTIQADFKQLDLGNVTGRMETRIAAALRVHPVIVGLSEGLQGSSLNAGNYAQVRRMWADTTIRPLWRIASASLQNVLKKPAGPVRLWYTDREVSFLREDAKAAAEITQIQAQTITQLVRDGFTAESAKEAVMTGDMTKLEHTGRASVQLQPLDQDPSPAPQEATDDEQA